jgi:prepilin-type N-terminal cleavage/methylation domain-containing protein
VPSAGDPGPARRWLLLLVVVSLVPVTGLFTTSRVFFVRDLSFFFWPRHLWLRHTIFSGQAPWWDPHVAAGQSAIADALNQLMMPLTVAIRLLPSDVVSFNLWVALPLPIAAIGMFLFLARRAPAAAAALGACVFALSGPMVSTLNTPNLSWSAALIPWVLWSVDRGGAAIAIAFGLQGLCGEPVTWAATGVLTACWIVRISRLEAESSRLKAGAVYLTYLGAGGLIAAMQLVPTFLAGVRAHRAAIATPDFWSLHPVGLWEAVAPNLFGNYYDTFLADLPWITALNFGRDPFFYSLYVGPLVLLLAAAGATAAPRRQTFWIVVAIAAVFCSFGGYTPVYPFIRKLLPPLMYFRFPVKYLIFAVVAVSALVAHGLASQPERLWKPAAFLSGIALVLTILALTLPAAVEGVSYSLAAATHLKDPAAGAAFLARTAPPLLARFAALLLAGTVLLAGLPRARYAAYLLFAAVCADLAITNAPLNLTMAAAALEPPAWFRESAGSQRLYIGGRARGYMNGGDLDGVKSWQIPAEATAIEGRMLLNAQLPMMPSGWRVREALSYDLPYLWPASYEAALRQFEDAGVDARAAFLRRSGVRRCVLPDTATRQFPVVADVPDWNMRVFECHPGATRVILASGVAVAADASDLKWQRDVLFDVSARDDDVRVDRMPATAGTRASPLADSVRLLEDGSTTVVVEATLSKDGTLVLRDTYDPSWQATVDGHPAEIARANGLYRAVALPTGRHVVTFTYRPRDFLAGLMISMSAAIALIVAARLTRRRGSVRSNAAGFTLIELMIVLAIIGILLAIAFNEYRGMQARGNEASAIGSLRSVATAQWQFASTCANGKYSTTFPGLGQAVPATGHAFLSPDLTQGEVFEKSGYTFEMKAKPIDDAPPACNGAAVAEGYAAMADPARPGLTGTNFYGVNSDRILYLDEAQTFKENLPESGPPNHGVEVR